MTTFGITTPLSNSDGSAGRDKADVRPVPDLGTHLSAAEWNNVKRAVVEMMGVLGRSSGADPSSIAAALLGMNYGPRTAKWRLAEDFLIERGEAVITLTGAGASAQLTAAEVAGDGAGHLLLQHGAVAGSVQWRPNTLELIDGGCNPGCRVRFKTPADMTLSDARIGISDAAVGSYAWIGWDHTTTLRLFCESANGGAADSTDLFTATGGEWQELEIRVVSGVSVGVYDASGTLIKSLNTAGAVLEEGDLVQPYQVRMARFGASASMAVDYMVGFGDRL